ncbi:hypothetical protein OG883_43115 [Streptomyces sp. NBC_01142]|uniref:hypothetical protein n=1 Tax=Streptomyces sp. NBC_01142 TaxID=2975865 RepID=UPI002252BFC5|nr:hypothetical protein [Streptomyces sp. NBC_01142]MCX4826433.1 hypothetical protein [Streptomyces sp. NBC_01142]
MPDEDLPESRPGCGKPNSKIGYVWEVMREVLQLIVKLAPMLLGMIALVALALSPLALGFYFLYQELGLLGAIAFLVLIVSVLRLLTV